MVAVIIAVALLCMVDGYQQITARVNPRCREAKRKRTSVHCVHGGGERKRIRIRPDRAAPARSVILRPHRHIVTPRPMGT